VPRIILYGEPLDNEIFRAHAHNLCYRPPAARQAVGPLLAASLYEHDRDPARMLNFYATPAVLGPPGVSTHPSRFA
jgi:hypothetical protein